MNEQVNPGVRFLLVYPKNKHRARYFVNENIRDSHALGYDDLYKFICTLITPPATTSASEYLKTFQPFIVDVMNNQAVKLRVDHKAMMDEIEKNHKKIDFDDIYNMAIEEYEETEDEIMGGSIQASTYNRKKDKELAPYQNQVNNVIDKWTYSC